MRLPFDKPVPKISSPFGWRVHPIEKIRKHHNGIDFAGSMGTPVHAIANGTVTYAGASRLKFPNGEPAGGGYLVQIRHKIDGVWITSTYMHMQKGSIAVKKGQKVVEGTIVGKLGNTGASTGPHLHFEIQNGKTYAWSLTGKRYEEPISFIKTQIALEKKK